MGVHASDLRSELATFLSKEPVREASASNAGEAKGLILDKGSRDDLMRMFLQLDEDGDGILNQKELHGAKELLAKATSGKGGERESGASVKQTLGVSARADDFMSYTAAVAKASKVPLPEMLKEMKELLLSRRRPSRPSNFNESVVELRQLGMQKLCRFCYDYFWDWILVRAYADILVR